MAQDATRSGDNAGLQHFVGIHAAIVRVAGMVKANCAAVVLGSSLNTLLGEVPFDGTVTEIYYISNGTITGADTDTRKLEVFNRGLNGAGVVSLGAKQFNATINAVAKDRTALTLTATLANRDVLAGQVLENASTFVGTGIADPGGVMVVIITPEA